MTGRQLKKMLVSEGFAQILIVFGLVLTVGSLITYGIVAGITAQMWFFTYTFVIWPVLACSAAFIALAVIIPVICYRIMGRDSVVDRLTGF